MILNHKDYLSYQLPNDWFVEESGENLLIYNPEGDGALTLSFFSILQLRETLAEHISIMAKRFINGNGIKLEEPLVLYSTAGVTTITGTGTTMDKWFVRLWIVAKQPRIVFATYQSEKKSVEVKICDEIIRSMRFKGQGQGDGSIVP